MKLRPYQLEALEAVRGYLRQGKARIMICAPTGAGKTVIASAIVTSALSKGNRVTIVAHRRELIKQAWLKFVRAGVPLNHIGVIMAGVHGGPVHASAEELPDGALWDRCARRNPTAPVQVCSIDSLRKRKTPECDLLIIDEAHRTLAKSYQDLISKLPDATVLGLTATPSRGDGRGLGEVYQAMHIVSSYRQLVEQGYLVEPICRAVSPDRRPDVSKVAKVGGDYEARALSAICDQADLVGDIVSHWKRYGNDAPTIAFATSVSHSQHIAETFRAAGITARHIDANTPTEQRDDAIAALAGGTLQVLCNVDVLTEGTDVPVVKTIISARPTTSLRVFLQQVGRGSRPSGDTPFVVLDHAGNCHEHGHPVEDQEWSLEPSSKKSATTSTPVRTCEVCWAVSPLGALVCVACGNRFAVKQRSELEHAEGDLVVVRPLTADELRVRWREVCDEYETRNRNGQRTSKRWCYLRFRSLYKRRPPRGCELPVEVAA